MAQQNGQSGPLSPEREVIQESDMHGIVALLQLSAGKREKSRKRRDSIGSPTQLGSPVKRSRGFSPGAASLSPSSRAMHMPTMHPMPCMSPPQVGLQSIQGLQVPGVASISSMVHLHELPDWARREQVRMDRATAPLQNGAVEMGFSGPGQVQKSQLRVMSKRALQREARRHALDRKNISDGLKSDTAARAISRDGLEGTAAVAPEVDGGQVNERWDKTGRETGSANEEAMGRTGPVEPMEQTGTAGPSPGIKPRPHMDLRTDDKHGSLLAFIGREFLYSDQDKAWYGEGRAWMDGLLQDMGFDTTGDVMLTKAEWAALQSSMKGSGDLRRLSSRFMKDSRAELRLYRERTGAGHAYTVGQAVTAMHPETLEIQDGIVLSRSGKDLYNVQFNRVDLGVHLIPASGLRKASQMSTGAQPPFVGQPGPSLQQLPGMYPPGMQSSPISMQNQHGMVGVPLSHMLAAFMQNTRTPETSPEKAPLYGMPGHQYQMPRKSPSQLLEDAYQLKLEEDAKAALESVFEGEALKGMGAAQKRRFVLSEMNKALRSACSQENRDVVDRNVSYMYADCADEIDSIKDGQGMLGGAIGPLLDFGLATEFQAGWRGHQRIRQELEYHIKELMAMLMMLERMPGMFEIFLRGLDLLA